MFFKCHALIAIKLVGIVFKRLIYCIYSPCYLRNATKQCDYSGSSREENECMYAHSMEELREWRQRHEYRFMKLNKAKKMELFSWLDNLAYEEASAEEAEEVVRE